MAETKKVLNMVFGAADGTSMTLTMENPQVTLTGAQIEAAMDTIIAKNIFLSGGGDLVIKKDAKIVDTTTNDLYTP